MTTAFPPPPSHPQMSPIPMSRAQALAESGRAGGFRFVQPRNLCWWVYIVLVVVGILSAIAMFAQPINAFGPAIAGSILLLTIYALILWWFTRHIDRYSPVPGSLIVTALMWGGFGATMSIAINVNTPLIELYAKGFGQQFAQNWGAGLAAPVVEELAKGLGVVLLIYLAPRVIRTSFDGFIVGAFIGLGFQTVEDVLYAMNVGGSAFGVDAGTLAIGNTLLRMATGLSGHILYSAVFGAGVVYLLGRPGEPRNVGRGVGLVVLAMGMHWFWDSLGALFPLGNGMFLVLLAVTVVVFLYIGVLVYRMVVTREQQYLRAVLAPEATSGLLTPWELDAIAGSAKQRRALRKALPDRAARRRQRWVVEASSDLADALARSGGADTPEVAFARSEVARIRSGTPAQRL